jgi:hypothetical protein
MHVANGRSKHIDYRLGDKLRRLLRHRELERFGRHVFDNFGGRANIANFTFDEHFRPDRFQGLDRLPGLPDVLFERLMRRIEDNFVKPGLGGRFGILERMRVVRIEKTRTPCSSRAILTRTAICLTPMNSRSPSDTSISTGTLS